MRTSGHPLCHSVKLNLRPSAARRRLRPIRLGRELFTEIPASNAGPRIIREPNRENRPDKRDSD